MKYLSILILTLWITSHCNYSISQDHEWTEAHDKIAAEYNLQKDDHRGILFIINEDDKENYKIDAEFNTLQEGLEYYMSKAKMKDVIYVYISGPVNIKYDFNNYLDVWTVIDLYLQATKQ